MSLEATMELQNSQEILVSGFVGRSYTFGQMDEQRYRMISSICFDPGRTGLHTELLNKSVSGLSIFSLACTEKLARRLQKARASPEESTSQSHKSRALLEQ